MADADFSGILNPKRVIRRREEEAETEPPAVPGNPRRFEKPFTPEERARQRQLLVQKLKALGERP